MLNPERVNGIQSLPQKLMVQDNTLDYLSGCFAGVHRRCHSLSPSLLEEEVSESIK